VKRWRCIVTVTYSKDLLIDAEDADDAGDTAIEQVMALHPFADDYSLAWAPSEVVQPADDDAA
jgi:hypothetical protein